mgnify:CR=1 FL=1
MINNENNLDLKTKNKIYLDYQASTPVDPEVLKAMNPYFCDIYGNPHSSEHSFGWKANDAIEVAKEYISRYINCLDTEIYFTSGATESNNLAITGTVLAALTKNINRKTILVSSIEHKCVLGAARFVQRFGFKVQKLPVTSDGIVDLQVLENLLKNNDVLLTAIMATNNEIGFNQPLNIIGDLCEKYGSNFHVDAAQGAYSNIDVVENKISTMSLSGHKVYGPKGIGCLLIRDNLSLKPEPIIYGGGQQNGFRSGTMPVELIVGMGEAFNILIKNKDIEIERVSKLRNKLLMKLQSKIDIKVNGTLKSRHPGNLNICLLKGDSKNLILSLQPNLAFSTGSACTSGIIEPSHVLKALGLSNEECDRSFRITVGRFTTEDDIDNTVELITDKYEKMLEIGE